jgi:hypothetical protein
MGAQRSPEGAPRLPAWYGAFMTAPFVEAGIVAPAPANRARTEERAALEHPVFLDHARTLEREHPEHLAALGMTAEDYASGMLGPSLTVEESVAAGWMSGAEGRFILGRATRDDLLDLGHTPDEARAILLDQQERACASST